MLTEKSTSVSHKARQCGERLARQRKPSRGADSFRSTVRLMGAFLVVLGCLFLAVDGTRWDVLLVALPSGGPGGGAHGLEASEVIGFVLALIGIAALWKH